MLLVTKTCLFGYPSFFQNINSLIQSCACFYKSIQDDYEHVSMLSKRLIDGITSKIQHVTLNGDPIQRYPGCVNFSFACVEGESLLMALKNVALSSGR